MKKPNDKLVEQHQTLRADLNAARAAADKAQVSVRKISQKLQDFEKEHGNVTYQKERYDEQMSKPIGQELDPEWVAWRDDMLARHKETWGWFYSEGGYKKTS